MKRYFKKKKLEESNVQDRQGSINKQTSSSSLPHVEINVDDLEIDPGLRKCIYAYDANARERERESKDHTCKKAIVNLKINLFLGQILGQNNVDSSLHGNQERWIHLLKRGLGIEKGKRD